MKKNKFTNFFKLVGEKIVIAAKYLIKEYKVLKEKEGYKKFIASLLAIVLGLLIGIILIIINKPGNALNGIC